MNLRKLLLTKNNCYKAGKKITVKGIMVHSTGANNPKLSRYVGPDDGLLGVNPNNNHWNTPTPGGGSRCVHAFIGLLKDGSVATYQTLPWDMRGWHGASGPKGCVNDTHIGFEICEDGLTDKTYFDKVYKEAVELCAYLCNLYKLDPLKDGVIICHSEGFKRGIASNHGDVMHWFPKHGKSMDTFRKDVKEALGGAVSTSAPTSTTATTATPAKPATAVTSYVVRVDANTLNIRKGAGTQYDIIGQITDKGSYTIVEESNGWGKLKSGAGWISLAYATKIK